MVNGNAGGGVIIDSNHKLNNQGTIQIGNVSNVAGGRRRGRRHERSSRSAARSSVDEAFTATDADNDGDLDGPFATGTNRFGIRTNGAFTGNILIGSTGTITVEGNNSAGISLGGPLTGNFTHDGKTNVLGNNSVGIQLSDVSGNVRLAGTISAQRPEQRSPCARPAMSRERWCSRARSPPPVIASRPRRPIPASSTPTTCSRAVPRCRSKADRGKGIILAVPPKDNSTTDTRRGR